MIADIMDLGSLEVEHTAAGLQLSLASRASFLAPSEDDVAPLAERLLTIAAINTGSSGRSRVVLDGDFSLVIHCENELGDRKDALLQAAARRFKNAQLWQQLHLDVVAVDCSTGNDTIKLTISRSDVEQVLSPRCLHKLRENGNSGKSLLLHDSKDIQLRQIYLDLRMICRHNSARERIPDSELTIVTSDYGSPGLPTISRGVKTPGRRVRSSPMSLTQLKQHTANACKDSQNDPSSTGLKRFSSLNDVQPIEEHDPDETAMLELLDASLLLAISSNLKHCNGNIGLLESSSFKPLAAVMPEIWSPNYNNDVSARSLFLPTLSHALSTVCGTHARNFSLQAKFAELCRRQEAMQHFCYQYDGSKCPQQQISAARRLCGIAEQSLYDEKSASSLRMEKGDLMIDSGDENVEMLRDFSDSESQDGEDILFEDDDYFSMGHFSDDEHDLLADPKELYVESNDEAEMFADVDILEPMFGEQSEQHLSEAEDEMLSMCGSVGSLVLMDERDSSGLEDAAAGDESRLQQLDDDDMLDI